MYLQHNVGRKWRKLLQKGFKLTFNLENVVLLSIIIFFKKTEKCYWRKITVKYHFESRLNLHNLQHTLISLVAPSCVGRNITFRTFDLEVFFFRTCCFEFDWAKSERDSFNMSFYSDVFETSIDFSQHFLVYFQFLTSFVINFLALLYTLTRWRDLYQ